MNHMNAFDWGLLGFYFLMIGVNSLILHRARAFHRKSREHLREASEKLAGAQQLLREATAIAAKRERHALATVEIGKSQWPMSTNN